MQITDFHTMLRSATPILQQDYTKFKEDDILKFTANIPAYEIRKKVVGQFTKACHTAYKFDSVPEYIFAIVLERSANVLKWLRPARDQFKIYFGSQRYQPDFLVETEKYIYIVEIKASNRSDDLEVKLKAKAAQKYCANVNTIFAETGKNCENICCCWIMNAYDILNSPIWRMKLNGGLSGEEVLYMFSKKGKRKIIVGGNTYYWSVKGNFCPCCLVKVEAGIFSEKKYLFGITIGEEYTTKYNTQRVTPAIVRDIILEYTHNLLNMKRVN